MKMPTLRVATAANAARLEQIRARAFAPIFASFPALLGDAIYEHAQRPEDAAQPALLRSLIDGRPGWTLWVAERRDTAGAVGFIAVRGDAAAGVGEIGLNAVDPAFASRGIGTAMYEFALERMREAGLRVAVVTTGADASHAAALQAYRNAGFEREMPSVWVGRTL